ncbi:hypothetical protein TrRE_jg500 [Triparma retinervis]|uniref:Uncharacterized protein n=1 Tax=Triparma retinervis TaxID=2557542 RepID=A0A9W7E3R7_9STRA|nr:hypothetical protein TrRE_jg500 [Triparma retinervis]
MPDWKEGFQLEQTRLHPSGCQQWHSAIVGGSDKYFAFCSTLSVYVYSTRGFQLEKLIDAHSKCITCLSWCPSNPSMFATGSIDGFVTVWDVEADEDKGNMVEHKEQ